MVRLVGNRNVHDECVLGWAHRPPLEAGAGNKSGAR